MKVTGDFTRLVISAPAATTEHGRAQIDRFADAQLPVDEVADDEAVSAHPHASQPSTLLVKYAPAEGWITSPDHGQLANRRGEYYLNPVSGCRSSCTYCYLRARPSGLRPLCIHVGLPSLFDALESHSARGMQPVLYATGELADSVADIEIYPIAAILAEYFATRTDARLELRTKDATVGPLLGIPHRGRTIIAFSLSPEEHVRRHEPGTATVVERLCAARKCQESGYPVAFKLEPLSVRAGWREDYDALLALMSSMVDISAIHHMSVGCLRWSEQLAMVKTFEKSHGDSIRNGDWVPYRDGRRNGTLARRERLAAYRWIRDRVRGVGIQAPLWWSLEQADLIAELERDVRTTEKME